jgi:cell division protein ZipA
MDELRWILLIAGIAVIAGIYGFSRWQDGRRKTRRGGSDAFADDADIDAALRDLDNVVIERDPLDLRDEELDVIPVTREQSLAPEPRAPAPVPAQKEAPLDDESEAPVGLEEKVVVLNVAATDGRMFSGHQLVEALEAAGMRLGEHAIYHRILDTRKGPLSLFSAADILRPGTLEPERLDDIQSPGVALFLQLPGPYDGLAAFEQMLETARRIADQLGVKLLDERRCSLTNQAIEHIREELREYRRLAHLMAKKG